LLGRQPLSPRSKAIINIGIAAIYVAAVKLGFTMAFTAEQVTPVWPPTGLSLAVLLLLNNGDDRDIRVWPGIFLGAFAANITTHEPFMVAAGIATGNTLEAVAAEWALRRVSVPGGGSDAVNRLRYALGIVVFGALASTIISATIGVTRCFRSSSGLRSGSASPARPSRTC
jgi:integral membrane sensor domain MASE1